MKTAVSKQTAGKIGLIGSISVIIAAVLGVGVFFKNGSVFSNNGNNQWGVLTSWLLAIVIALFTAFSFAEIVSVKGLKNPNAGLAGWSGKIVGYNFGRHVSVTQSTFYYPAKFVAMATFAAVAILQVYYAANPNGAMPFAQKFDASYFGISSKYTTLIVMGIAVFLIAAFMLANLFSSKFGQVVAKGATFIKLIPIFMIIFIGLIVGFMIGKGMWGGEYIKQISKDAAGVWVVTKANNGAFDINGVFRSIPAILFAFDSFLVIGNVSKNVENPEKNVPLSIIISMIIAAILQILITIACITVGTGNPYELLKATILVKCGSQVGYIICVCILSVSIVTATLGVLNSYSMAGTRATQALVDEKTIIGYRWAGRIQSKTPNLGGFYIYLIWIAILYLVIAIPSCILNTSNIYDGFSTLAVLFYFGIYGTTILFGLINRKTNKAEVRKVGYFIPFGIIAVIGCYFAFAYSAFYQFLTQVAMNPTAHNANSFGFAMIKEGMFDGKGMMNWQAACVFWSAAIFFLGFPFVNDLIIKLSDKHYDQQFIWEVKKTQHKSFVVAKKVKVEKPVVIAAKVEKPAKVEVKPVVKKEVIKKPVVKQPKVKKEHPYRVIGIAVAVTLVVGALVTMLLTLLA